MYVCNYICVHTYVCISTCFFSARLLLCVDGIDAPSSGRAALSTFTSPVPWLPVLKGVRNMTSQGG